MKSKTLFNGLIILSGGLFSLASCKKQTTPSVSDELNAGKSGVAEAVDSSIIAYYNFNGNTKDKSLYGNDITGTFNIVPAKGQNGMPGSAFSFNGFSSYMLVPNSSSLNPKNITIYALIKPQGYYQGQCHGNRIVHKGYLDQSNGAYHIGYTDAPYYNFNQCNQPVQERFQNFEGGYGDISAAGLIDETENIRKGNWYKLTYTYDGTAAKLYINGVLKKTVSVTTGFTPNQNNVFIGQTGNPQFPYWFNGIIDEIKIYNRGLSAKEVSKL